MPSLESRRVAPEQQARVRRLGTILAIGLRILLLFVVLQLISVFQAPWFTFDSQFFSGSINGHSLIVLFGGLFLIRTAVKEIQELLHAGPAADDDSQGSHRRTVPMAIFWILVMNIVFSFDTVLSAVALTRQFYVMALAIIFSGILMVWLTDQVSRFLERNRLYEVLGLFVLLLVGAMLMAEGGSIAKLTFFGFAVEPMAKSTFYFILAALVAVDILQGRYQKKLDAERDDSG